MGKSIFTNSFATLAASYVAASVAVTAGGTGDATEVNGAWIDVTDTQSVTFLLPYTTTLGEDATLTIAANLQEATDSSGTGAADYGDAIAATVVSTGGTGGSTNTGVVAVEFDVTGAEGFVRLQFTPNLSAANTDTAAICSAAVVGPGLRSPATATGFTRLS